MKKGFMYIDEEITLDFPMPTELKEYCDGMDAAFERNDQPTWDYYHEVIGSFAKQEYSVGHITFDQMYMIWERYGTAG